MSQDRARDPLTGYHEKRRVEATPEPFTSTRHTGGHLFVIHHHAARAVHFDLRLEVDGALWSWAVPKGPSPDPAEKRLAVQVEPHPVDYAWFEGLIPAGNYGAGAMIIWDRGNWRTLTDPHEGLRDGKLLFDLQGYKLHGRWTLVRTGRKGDSPGRQWLLIKEQDAWVGRIPDPPETSVISGLTVKQLKAGADPGKSLATRLKRAGAPAWDADLADLRPMLCQPSAPFSDPQWLFEVKYDGYRVMACRDGEAVALMSRNGRDIGAGFPELVESLAALPYAHFAMDAELVVNGADGLPDFSALQKRAGLSRPHDVERASISMPATLFVFDLPVAQRLDLRQQPLLRRKQWLAGLLPPAGALRYVDHVKGRGEALYEQAVNLGLEGLVAKAGDSPYLAGKRSDRWRKIAALRNLDVVVLGMIPDGPDNFRSLIVGARDGDNWVSLGRVGSGLDERQRAQLRSSLEALRTDKPAVKELKGRGVIWTRPEVVVSVRYKMLTRSGQLRQPVLVALRPDKPALQCQLPESAELPEPAEVSRPAQRQRVIPSNVEKVFWPGPGFTKGDLLKYYQSVAPWMLPWLKDRPIVMTRYPDGVEGKSFFQHEAPDYLPDWIATCSVEKKRDSRRYVVVDSLDSLLYLANLGTIEFHAWSSRCQSIGFPDYCILDLDPKGAAFADVVAIARELHRLCKAAAIPHLLKTSGGTGLHILIPLDGSADYEQSRQLAELLARLCVARLPDIATIQRAVKHRAGRVYIDYMQNGYGKTIASAFSARPVAAGSVSMPLRFAELKSTLDPARYNLKSAPRRMRKLNTDPAFAVLENPISLADALAGLANYT